MRLPELIVEVTRSAKTRDLQARVVQRDAERPIRGSNILTGRHLRRIDSAIDAIRKALPHVDSLTLDIQAPPDLKPPYRHVLRRGLQQEISS